MVKAVIFDYGGVMGTSTTWQEAVKGAPGLARFDSFLDAIKATGAHWQTAKVGGNTAPFWQALSELIEKPPDEVKELLISTAHPDSVMLELVDRLRKKYKVALLSNHINDWLEPIIATGDLRSKFDVIVTSYEQKIAKPDARIFKTVLNELDVKPEHAVFIDDQSHNVAAARDLGMTGLDFESVGKLKEDLNKLGI